MLVLSAKHSDVLCLCDGCLQLRPGLLDFDLGTDSSVKPTLVQLQRLLVLSDGRLQKLFLGIQTARLKVEQGELRVDAQVDRRQVSGTGWRLPPGGGPGLCRQT